MSDSDFVSPVTPTQSNAQAMLKNFLAAVLPTGVAIVTAQQNRVAEPTTPTFVIMTPIRFLRLNTDIYTQADARFNGSIAGTTLTVGTISLGAVNVGATLFGSGVTIGTRIVALGPLASQYLVTPSQTVPSTVMSAGTEVWQENAELTVQLDFHSADTSAAGDMAQTVSTMFRTSFAVEQFQNQSPTYDITPFDADDPKMMPFINENQQYEWRWVTEARMQMNQVVSIPVAFADSIKVTTVNVEAAYPS